MHPPKVQPEEIAARRPGQVIANDLDERLHTV